MYEHKREKRFRIFYKVMIAILVVGFALMAGLVVTGLTLARISRDVAEPVEIPVEAMISLSPTYGGANTLVNITGMGFPENDRVSFYITPPGVGVGTQPHGEALTNAEGMFSVMFSMPATWPDGSAIMDENLVVLAMANKTAEDGGSSIVQAVADFRYLPVVQPEISINPTGGVEGTLVTVTNTGFPANQPVGIYLGMRDGSRPLTQTYALGTADANGQLTQTFVMPEFWPDGTRIREEQLEIVAQTNDGSVRASAGFDYEPFPYPLITVSPNFGGPDTAVSITGDGFPAGAHVLIKLGTSVDDAAGKPAYIDTRADLQGNIDLPFTMPGFWPGGLPILTRDVVVLATTGDGRGYGWMGFAYLKHAAAVEQGSSGGEVAEVAPTVANQEPAATTDPGGAETEEPPPVTEEPTVESGIEPGTETPPAAEVKPSISLAPATGGAGTVVQVTGTGFRPDLPLTVRLGLPATGLDNTVYGSVVSDASGSFVAQMTMPATWPDGAPIIETSLVVVVTNGDGHSKAGAEFIYVPAVAETAPPVDVCDVRYLLAGGLGVAPDQIDAQPADVVDPGSGKPHAGCVLRFDVVGQPPMETIRTALSSLGWHEDAAGANAGASVFRSGNSLIVVRLSEAKCAASDAGEGCPAESVYYTVTFDYVEDMSSQ
ncbi:MAG: hypothetical protein JXB30_10800 [Anaerolineae bacterium]|nr:hypothetical protein [Anaerolineae bacterium]